MPDRRVKARWRASAAVAVLCALLGVAIVTQVRETVSEDNLDAARPAELLAVLDGLHRREAVLRTRIADLEGSLAAMEADGTRSQAAVDDARSRLAALQILAGTVPAEGPGVEIIVADPDGGVGPEEVLDQMQELRAAGAEVIEFVTGEQAVRIGVDSAITGRSGAVQVDGTTLEAGFTVRAIGDPDTLAAALNIPGGAVDTVQRAGGRIEVRRADLVQVDSVRDDRAAPRSGPGD